RSPPSPVDPRDLPFRVEVATDTLAEDYRARTRAAMTAWDDDDLLTATLTALWGLPPGASPSGASSWRPSRTAGTWPWPPVRTRRRTRRSSRRHSRSPSRP